jgi:hypothetical protein
MTVRLVAEARAGAPAGADADAGVQRRKPKEDIEAGWRAEGVTVQIAISRILCGAVQGRAPMRPAPS